MNKTINNNQLRASDIGKKVTLYGFVANKRKFGELSFIDLRDRYGITQLVFKENTTFSRESVLEVTGTVALRKEENKLLETGQIEILVESYKVLSLANDLPFVVRDDVEVKEENRLQYRYLDLRRPIMQKNLILKNKVFHAIREFMQENDFLEMETPILAKGTPEGARDFLVPTRNEGKFFALPQSPQLFKQLLMVSGLERYYQFAKCFRDEDSRKDRQLEFIQLDIETSYLSVENFQAYIEKLFKYVMHKIGIEIKIPFQRLKYFDCIRDYGTDKPDLRFDLKIQDINEFCNSTDFNIIKNASSKRMLIIEQIIEKKTFKNISEIAKKNKVNALFYFAIENSKVIHSNFASKVQEEVDILIKKQNIVNGTVFIAADKYESASQALGALRVELNNLFNYARDEYNFSWITDWPMFEFVEEENRWQAAHHPFTQFDNDLEEVKTMDKEKIMAKSYDLVFNGFELGSGSARIYNPVEQELMFDMIGLDKKQQEEKFGWFLRAFKYGVPPHCGIGLGMDRLIMILANQKTIRDVIPFPKNSKGQDVMTDAPNNIEQNSLDEVFITIKDQK
ncbi:aspartate--tRNA ligase [Mycoplasmopsis alligatoris]|uniref:Aspartate--tRNA ligase n=1 Tax=Mycoplasmopsis alligatoris A21JP2 TaxID=747682 RepID=D4XV89_9BACT|nr:aspartate--tRNA ligase [Mycoplasmopsis alligatoris]EFF41733.1 aspartate--tRNA ligase [Mycoplasmopsis alligatoris A21JP2]